ncbi:MAG: C40 family peptidase [Paludibacteraceae bacterium]|nr:C40 family peptidase [Paludibacteraceae bacterium]
MSVSVGTLMAAKPRTTTVVVHDTVYVPQYVYVHDTIVICPDLEEMMFDIDAMDLTDAQKDSLLDEIVSDLEAALAMEDSLYADSLARLNPEPMDGSTADQLIAYAKRYIGRPYVYGAGGPKSFDCSGFTSYVFRHVGIHLTRTSSGQSQQARRIRGGFRNLRKGDLVFFGRRNRHTVGHVGIVISATDTDFTFIHAAVHSGITISHYHERYYRSCYMFAGRILP